MRISSRRLTICMPLLALASLTCCVVYADTYSPGFLFTLEYGEGEAQIGMSFPRAFGERGEPSGPTGIAVGPGQSIYIADRINGCIKSFDPTGNLMMRTEGVVGNIQYLAVDSQGNAYALGGGGIGTLVKFAPDGKQLWRKELLAVVPSEVRRQFGPLCSAPVIGPYDTIFLTMEGRNIGVVSLDQDGNFLGAYGGYTATPTGKIASVGPAPDRSMFAAEVILSDLDGKPLYSYSADSWAGDPSVFVGAEHNFSFGLFDGTDHLHQVAHARRDYPIVLSQTKDLVLAGDVIITRHDTLGRPVAYLRLPASPLYSGRNITVGSSGNIYHMSFGESSVDIVKYSLMPSAQQVGALRGLPTLSTNGIRYVPLRLIAEYCNLDLRWDALAKQATLSHRPDGRARADRATVTLGDSSVILYEGRLWLSIAASNMKLASLLKTDRNHLLAYIETVRPREVAFLAD